MLKLSVVIPCFNESKRLNNTLSEALIYLVKNVHSFEVIFVNDGSTDNTVEKIHKLCAGFKDNYKILSLPVNNGKGYAIHEGVLGAQGGSIVFLDADFSTPIETVEPALKALKKGADVVIASRRHPMSHLVVPQGKARIFLGKGFTWLTNAWLLLSVSDITCGFKCFKREVAKELFAKQHQFDWSFDAEILFLATRKGYQIEEIPVAWTNKKGTKVNIIRDVIRSLIGLVKIRARYFLGKYA